MKKNIWLGICVIFTIGFGLFIFENTDKIENFKTVFSQKSEKNSTKGVKKGVKTETKKTEIKSSMESELFVDKNEEIAEDREVYIEELLYPDEYEWTEEEHGKVMLEAGKKFIADYNRFVNLKDGDIFSINIEGKLYSGTIARFEYEKTKLKEDVLEMTSYYVMLNGEEDTSESISVIASKTTEEGGKTETENDIVIDSINGRYKIISKNGKGLYADYRKYDYIWNKYYTMD